MTRDSRSDRSSRRHQEATAFARSQRAQANEFAQIVWQIIRNRACRRQKFRREYPIPPYTVDFCCVELKLVIEVDGEHHFTGEGHHHDQRRDRFLADLGYQVLRILGYDTLHDPQHVRTRIEGVIDACCVTSSPSPPAPLPRVRGRGEPDQ